MWTPETLLPLAAFVFVASITPGPNNIMLATAGATAGFRATIPHMLGISLGHAAQVALIGLGIGALLSRWPALLDLLRWVAAGYLIWLAWQLARARPPAPGNAGSRAGRPLSFVGAALFQWINPKAWMMALTVTSAFLPAGAAPLTAAVSVAAITAVINLPCVSCWAGLGSLLGRHLASPRQWRVFNLTMAALLLATVGTVVR